MLTLQDYVIKISVRTEDFRVAVGPPCPIVVAGGTLLTQGIFLLNGSSNLAVLLFIIPVCVVALCLGLLMLLGISYHLEVGPEGISRRTWIWRQQFIPWSAITEVYPRRLAGLEYLIIKVRNRRLRIWIPLFVTRYDLLCELLTTYADTAHRLGDKLNKAA